MKLFLPCKLLIALAMSAAAAVPVSAQKSGNTYSVSSWWNPSTSRFSPVVEPGGKITFRIKSPSAKKVNLLFGEWDVTPRPLSRDTAGVWSVTIGGVQPGVYSYIFTVDGQRTPDFSNPVVKRGTEVYGSIVEVPGTAKPRFDEIRDLPHGVLIMHTYTSAVLKRLRGVYVYLPAAYSSDKSASYPVLYLRHGGGDDESSWTQESGKANVIVDNLVADKQAVPMIVVMSNGLTDGSWAGGSTKEGVELLEQELLEEIIPMVETNYRTLKGPDNRAIAGLSMGGGQAYIIGLRHPEYFSWIGEFSSGLLSDVNFKIEDRVPGAFSDVAKFNSTNKLLFIGCGLADPRYPGHQDLASGLKKKGVEFTDYPVPGGHEWQVWREELKMFCTKIFK